MTALQSDQQKAPFEWINWLTLILPVPVASEPLEQGFCVQSGLLTSRLKA